MTAQLRTVCTGPHGDCGDLPLHPEDEEAGARRDVVRAAAAGLLEAVAAEARAVGAQVRCIHRLWLVAQEARTAARFRAMAAAEAEVAARGSCRPDPLGPLAEAEHQLVVDVAAEVGPALRLPAGTARRRVEDAVVLAEMLPEVLAALETGRIGAGQAAVLVEQWRELVVEAPTWTRSERVAPPVEAAGALIAELLERAPFATAAQLRAAARARRAVLVAGAAERARRVARKRRAVWVEPADDGLAGLHALLDAPVACAVQERVEELAGLLEQEVPVPAGLSCLPRLDGPEEAEPRSVGELRADVLADLLLDGVLPDEPGFPRGVRGQVSVMVPISCLTAKRGADGPGRAPEDGAAPVLSGYGPISTEVARRLAAGAGAWHRVLTHPGTGVVLDHDRTVYAVPADLRRLVELRDGTCRFPGCRRRAQACDLDHTVAWADGGVTAERNLAALCRAHHRIKHRTGHLGRWSVRRVPDGPGHEQGGGPPGSAAVLEWTSPGGLVHRTVPEHARPDPMRRRPEPGTARQHSGPRNGDPPPFDPDDDVLHAASPRGALPRAVPPADDSGPAGDPPPF